MLHGANRAQLGLAIGQRHRHDVGLAALRLSNAEAQPSLGVLEILDPDADQLGAAQRAGKPHQQQRTVAQGREVVAHRR